MLRFYRRVALVGAALVLPDLALAESLSVLRADTSKPIHIGVGQSLTLPTAFELIEVSGSHPQSAEALPESIHAVNIAGNATGRSTLLVMGMADEFALVEMIVGAEQNATQTIGPLEPTIGSEVIPIESGGATQPIALREKDVLIVIADMAVGAVASSNKGVIYPILLWPQGSEYWPGQSPIYVGALSKGTAIVTMQTPQGAREVRFEVTP